MNVRKNNFSFLFLEWYGFNVRPRKNLGEVNNMEFEEIKVEEVEYKESEVVKFEEAGQEFIGRYLGFIEFSNDNGDGLFYKFADVDDDDLEYIIFGGLTVLDDRMKKVPLEGIAKIVYKGKKQSSKNKSRYFKDFQVFVAKE